MKTRVSVHSATTYLAILAAAFFAALALALGFTATAYADSDEDEYALQSVMHLPDVTDEMTDASYWIGKQQDPDTVLADRATIDTLNQAGIDGDGTGLQPLREASGTYYNADKQQTLKNGAAGELNSMLESLDWSPVYKENWELIDQEYVDGILENYPTDGAVPDIASPYAIVTTHTTMRAYPTDDPILYTEGDYDDDNLYLSALRVNEPLIIRAESVDKRFYLCISSCINAAWVPVEDVAICANHDEWLEAWDIPAGQELVVTGYKVFTEKSAQTPNISKRMLYMGTTLERVDLNSPEEALEIVGTSSAFDRHVCYLPVRNEDGTYSKELALIGASAKVSEGFLPLTTANIGEVAFRSLGQMYGWGGMLEANDCSGYVRDVYKCFGLELARNTTWQMTLPVRKYDLTGLDDVHKAAAIAQMPLGTVLFWGGHEMIYLGQDNGKLYVISAVGGIGDNFGEGYTSYQVKGVVINTLDIVRASRVSWLSTLTCANIPYISNDVAGPSLYDVAFYENATTWPKKSYAHTGEAITPKVSIDGLEKGADYKVSFKDNVSPGTATVTISGIGDYSGSMSNSFQIGKIAQAIKATKSVKKSVNASTKTKKITKNRSFSLKKLAKVSAKTKVKYKKANKAGGKKIVVNAKTGKVTLKKGLKKGAYKVKVKLTAPANSMYEAAKAKSITLKVVVK
ncbi:MAG: NlpC/P60 family protein [Coriobacteriia bacterium]|nr:NlpC/P60 family protein [Coriobacteriia bacterium]